MIDPRHRQSHGVGVFTRRMVKGKVIFAMRSKHLWIPRLLCKVGSTATGIAVSTALTAACPPAGMLMTAVFLTGGACAGIAVSKPTERELLAFAGEVEESIEATKAALNH